MSTFFRALLQGAGAVLRAEQGAVLPADQGAVLQGEGAVLHQGTRHFEEFPDEFQRGDQVEVLLGAAPAEEHILSSETTFAHYHGGEWVTAEVLHQVPPAVAGSHQSVDGGKFWIVRPKGAPPSSISITEEDYDVSSSKAPVPRSKCSPTTPTIPARSTGSVGDRRTVPVSQDRPNAARAPTVPRFGVPRSKSCVPELKSIKEKNYDVGSSKGKELRFAYNMRDPSEKLLSSPEKLILPWPSSSERAANEGSSLFFNIRFAKEQQLFAKKGIWDEEGGSEALQEAREELRNVLELDEQEMVEDQRVVQQAKEKYLWQRMKGYWESVWLRPGSLVVMVQYRDGQVAAELIAEPGLVRRVVSKKKNFASPGTVGALLACSKLHSQIDGLPNMVLRRFLMHPFLLRTKNGSCTRDELLERKNSAGAVQPLVKQEYDLLVKNDAFFHGKILAEFSGAGRIDALPPPDRVGLPSAEAPRVHYMSPSWLKGTVYREHPQALEAKVDLLVALLRQSKHTVVYSGAGISTAADIPQYAAGANKGTSASANIPKKVKPTKAHYILAHLAKHGFIHR